MFDKILEIKKIRAQKSDLSERETELSKPILSDIDTIPEVYRWFLELIEISNCPSRPESSALRKKFIFIVLLIYAPAVLAGGRMPLGLREKIGSVFNLKDHTFISHNIENVVFLYQNYKSFRREIDYLYTEIIGRLKIEGLIQEESGA